MGVVAICTDSRRKERNRQIPGGKLSGTIERKQEEDKAVCRAGRHSHNKAQHAAGRRPGQGSGRAAHSSPLHRAGQLQSRAEAVSKRC